MRLLTYYIFVLILIITGQIVYSSRNRLEKIPRDLVIYFRFVIPFLLIVIFLYLLAIKSLGALPSNDRLNLIGQVSGLIFAIGVGLLAFLQLAHSSNEEKAKTLKARKQFLEPIEKELREVGWWTGLNNNTGGYKLQDELRWKQENLRMRINLGNQVNPLSFSFIEKVNLLPGLTELSREKPLLTDLLVGYLLWCKIFNNFLLDISQFIASNATIEFYEKTSNTTTPLTTILGSLSKEEMAFANILFEKYVYLHFHIIGSDETTHLYHYHKRLSELISELKQSTEQKINEFEKNNYFGKLFN